MNWSKASAAAEILSSLAILVTLFYLTIEIRQNAEATRAETRQSILASDQEFLMGITNSPELDFLYYKPELTDEEKVRLSTFLLTFARMRENNWFQYTNGILDEELWASYQSTLIATMSTPRTRRWWQNFVVSRTTFSPGFVSEMSALLDQEPVREQSPHLAAFD